MKKNSEAEDPLQNIMADRQHAQILIECHSPNTLIEAANAIQERGGARVLQSYQISADWGLIKLDPCDMREIALMLTEHGFSIKGINASHSDKKGKAGE